MSLIFQVPVWSFAGAGAKIIHMLALITFLYIMNIWNEKTKLVKSQHHWNFLISGSRLVILQCRCQNHPYPGTDHIFIYQYEVKKTRQITTSLKFSYFRFPFGHSPVPVPKSSICWHWSHFYICTNRNWKKKLVKLQHHWNFLIPGSRLVILQCRCQNHPYAGQTHWRSSSQPRPCYGRSVCTVQVY